MDNNALFNSPCSFADVARLQAALDLFAPGSLLTYSGGTKGVQIRHVLVPIDGRHDVHIIWAQSRWAPMYYRDGKPQCKMREHAYLLDAIRGAFTIKDIPAKD